VSIKAGHAATGKAIVLPGVRVLMLTHKGKVVACLAASSLTDR